MNIQGIVGDIMQRHFFDRMGGVKVEVVYPTDERVKEIKYGGVPGKIESHLANFGKY